MFPQSAMSRDPRTCLCYVLYLLHVPPSTWWVFNECYISFPFTFYKTFPHVSFYLPYVLKRKSQRINCYHSHSTGTSEPLLVEGEKDWLILQFSHANVNVLDFHSPYRNGSCVPLAIQLWWWEEIFLIQNVFLFGVQMEHGSHISKNPWRFLYNITELPSCSTWGHYC